MRNILYALLSQDEQSVTGLIETMRDVVWFANLTAELSMIEATPGGKMAMSR